MEIVINDDPGDPVDVASLRDLAIAVMEAQGLPDTAELAITLLDASAMSTYNHEHMGQAGPTDVLSFPIEDFDGEALAPAGDGPPLLLGDVFICPPVVRINAVAAGVAFEDEMALMVVHGILHLLGYDHVVDADAEIMESRERELLRLVGRRRP